MASASKRSLLSWWVLGVSAATFLFYLVLVNLEDPRRFPAFNAFAEFIAVPLVFLLLAIPLLSGWLLWRLPEGKWRPALALFLALGSLLLIALEILSSGGC